MTLALSIRVLSQIKVEPSDIQAGIIGNQNKLGIGCFHLRQKFTKLLHSPQRKNGILLNKSIDFFVFMPKFFQALFLIGTPFWKLHIDLKTTEFIGVLILEACANADDAILS
jgi:hypothetical protein